MSTMPTTVPEFLYHIVLTVTDYSGNSSASAHSVYVLGTHSTLDAARRFAQTALTSSLHFEPSDFAVLKHAGDADFHSDSDGAVVFANALSGQQLVVAVATTSNRESLVAGQDGGVIIPGGARHLHYIVQTSVDYNKDRGGVAQSIKIVGCFVRRNAATAAARACLAANKIDFAQYDEKSDLGDSDDWPFGEEAVVHAVSNYGETFTVSVTIPPEAKTVRMHHRKGEKEEPHPRLEAGVGLGVAV